MLFLKDVQNQWSTFCKEKLRADREIRQREVRAKQLQMMKDMILQQQLMNTAFLTGVKKPLDE